MKIFKTVLLCTFIVCAFWTAADISASAKNIEENVLRIHIRAQDDTDEAQNLKIKLKDELLKEIDGMFDSAQSADDAAKIASDNITVIEDFCNRYLKEHGVSYKASASVEYENFPTKEYENLALPKGRYKALVIKLGEAKGHNWWCMIYPSLCVGGNGDIDEALGDDSKTVESKYSYDFKLLELLGDLRDNLK